MIWLGALVVAIVFGIIVFGKGLRIMVKAYMSKYLVQGYNFGRSSTLVQNMSRKVWESSVNSNLPVLASVERVSENTFRILAQNPGYHTLQGTNTYLVTGKGGSSHILIDTGELITANKFIPVLFDQVFVAAKTARLRAILLTHGHADHVGGLLPILEELRKRNMTPLPQIYKRVEKDNQNKLPVEIHNIEHDQTFEVDDKTHLKAIYTPGHTSDHVSFILEEDHALVSGDCILGCGTSVFDDLYDYMKSLERLKHLIIKRQGTTKEITSIYPGHGPVIRNAALDKIEEYIVHRNNRERQILRYLQNLAPGVWENSFDMVGKIYGKLPLGVVMSAQANLVHHLNKLKKEGYVIFEHPDCWRAAPNSIKH